MGATGKVVLGAVGLEAAAAGLFYYGGVTNKDRQINQANKTPGNLVMLGDKAKFDNIADVEKIDYNAEIEDGWVIQNRKGFVYVTKDNQDELLFMSPTCTHLGCTVAFATPEEKESNGSVHFKCPCHGGEFDKNGINVGGPPPRPFDVFQPIVKDNKIYIDIFSPIKRG